MTRTLGRGGPRPSHAAPFSTFATFSTFAKRAASTYSTYSPTRSTRSAWLKTNRHEAGLRLWCRSAISFANRFRAARMRASANSAVKKSHTTPPLSDASPRTSKAPAESLPRNAGADDGRDSGHSGSRRTSRLTAAKPHGRAATAAEAMDAARPLSKRHTTTVPAHQTAYGQTFLRPLLSSCAPRIQR